MAGPFYTDGKYHVQIIDVAMGESKVKQDGSGGNPQVVLKVKVISGLVVASDGSEVSSAVSGQYDRTIYLTVTEKSKEMVLAKLRWAGWDGDRFETLTKDLLGRGCRAICKIEPSMSEKYAGQDTEKWDLELPPLESKPLENKPAVAKKLNALFGKTLKEKPASAAPAKEPVGVAVGDLPPHGEPPPDDDVPF